MPVHAVERQERPKHLGQLLRIGELGGQPHEKGQSEDEDELDDSNDHQEADERHAQAARVRELAHIEHERDHLVLRQQPELLRRNRCEAWLVAIPGINDVERVEAEEQCEAHGGDLGGARDGAHVLPKVDRLLWQWVRAEHVKEGRVDQRAEQEDNSRDARGHTLARVVLFGVRLRLVACEIHFVLGMLGGDLALRVNAAKRT